MFESTAEARREAIPADDVFFGRLAAALTGTRSVVVVGFAEAAEADSSAGPAESLPYNSAALIDSTGVVAVYRKTHLWDREKLFFTPGSAPPPVVETAHGRIGLAVCYDFEFPEMPRMLALAGADILVVPTNWPWGERPEGERSGEVLLARAAALANGVFVACCDRRGVERGQAWNEGTVIVDPRGRILSAAVATDPGRPSTVSAAEAVDPAPRAVADVVLARARDKRLSERNDLFADRRPDVYPS